MNQMCTKGRHFLNAIVTRYTSLNAIATRYTSLNAIATR